MCIVCVGGGGGGGWGGGGLCVCGRGCVEEVCVCTCGGGCVRSTMYRVYLLF